MRFYKWLISQRGAYIGGHCETSILQCPSDSNKPDGDPSVFQNLYYKQSITELLLQPQIALKSSLTFPQSLISLSTSRLPLPMQ